MSRELRDPFVLLRMRKLRSREMTAEPGDTQVNEDTPFPDHPVKLEAWC